MAPGMLVVENICGAIDDGALSALERDYLVMTFEERRWLRRRVTTRNGREIALALPTGTVLAPGTILLVETNWYLEIEAALEPVLAVSPRDRAGAIRIAFEVGNHHFRLALDGEALLIPDDPAMTQMLDRLGARWDRRLAPFDPIGHGHNHER